VTATKSQRPRSCLSEETRKARQAAEKRNHTGMHSMLEMEVEQLEIFHSELRKDQLARCNIGSSTDTDENTK